MTAEGLKPEGVRAAELIGALSLATDLGMGFPLEHGLQSTLVAMRLCDRLAVDSETTSHAYYACLLFYVGCTVDAEVAAETFPDGNLFAHFQPVIFGSPRETMAGIVRALADPGKPGPLGLAQAATRLPKAIRGHRRHIAALCEVAQMLSERLGAPQPVAEMFAHLTERWDGKSEPGLIKGEELPLPLRIVHVARDAAFQQLIGGVEHAAAVIAERAGRAFDPEIAGVVANDAVDLLQPVSDEAAWSEVLGAEPKPRITLVAEAVDRALAAMGDFADLLSPFLTGHSAGVSSLAAAAAEQSGLAPSAVAEVRRGGWVHDLGRVAVSAGTWQSEGPLTRDEWEQVRLHAYYTERILSLSPFLTELIPAASFHHERIDGTGYHRSSKAAAITAAGRLVAAADRYHAMTSSRPHRNGLTPERAAALLSEESRTGGLDSQSVEAVLTAAGQPRPRHSHPAGLTDREVEVVVLLARGLQTKQIARALSIAASTADHHVQHAYSKMGVSTRAAAAVFAMEHGLTEWRISPIPDSVWPLQAP
ncbi:MAG TPA: HD domain-containing phosphohydrolase [Acidimicrobiia bacterium]|nr:HD domain-containing phosphohydrolase [Acidimicrobiia bacterium]